jgi:hypothetical protein
VVRFSLNRNDIGFAPGVERHQESSYADSAVGSCDERGPSIE